MSAVVVILEAFISPGPFASSINLLVVSELPFKASDLTFKTISVTSSLTPLIDVNSCNTPSICIAVTAVPLIDESRILLKELPKVSPYPFSKGSAIILAYDLSSLRLTSSFGGLISDFQFLIFTSAVSFYTLLFLGGREPLCGIGVVSFIEIILKPLACKALKAVSLPDPGPFTSTDNIFIPTSKALTAAESAATWAA